MRPKHFYILIPIISFVILALGGDRLCAQTGTISGKIKLDDGQPAIGAQVFVYAADGEEILGDANTNQDNDNQGKFITNQIAVGVYTVTIKFEGYQRIIITGVPIEDKKSTDISLRLELLDPHEPEEVTNSYSTLFPKTVQPPPPKKSEESKKKGKTN